MSEDYGDSVGSAAQREIASLRARLAEVERERDGAQRVAEIQRERSESHFANADQWRRERDAARADATREREARERDNASSMAERVEILRDRDDAIEWAKRERARADAAERDLAEARETAALHEEQISRQRDAAVARAERAEAACAAWHRIVRDAADGCASWEEVQGLTSVLPGVDLLADLARLRTVAEAAGPVVKWAVIWMVHVGARDETRAQIESLRAALDAAKGAAR